MKAFVKEQCLLALEAASRVDLSHFGEGPEQGSDYLTRPRLLLVKMRG